MRRILLALALYGGLAGCEPIESESFSYRLGVDPMNTDPAKIVALVTAPEGVTIPPRGVLLYVAAARVDSQEVLAGWYPMVLRGDLWRMTEDDAAALRELQKVMRLWELEAPDKAHAGLNLEIKVCATGPALDPNTPVSVKLSGDGGAQFRTVLRNLTVEEALAAKGSAPPLPPLRCQTTGRSR